ncbi:MAG: branched-chain amino acid transport system permease protein [Desulforhopalus sp.]|jgi:branched-chain amino acid transport system permease protein
MQFLNRHTIVLLAGSAFFLFLPLFANLTDQPYLLSLFSRILIYALAAVSLDLLIGFGGLVSLGHAAYLGIGAYVVAIFYQHGIEAEPLISWPIVINGSENAFIVWPVAVLIAALFALFFGALSLRTTGMHFIMITLAFAQMLYYFFISLGKYGGNDGVSLYNRNSLAGLDLADDMLFYYLCLFFLTLFLVLTLRLSTSRFGLVLRGTKNNERRINMLGISSFRYKLTCFVIAGAGAGLAGVLLANHTEYVSPGLLHWTLSGELMVMVLMGGLGTLYGPIAGATVFLLLEEYLAIYTEHWMLYMGPVLILIVIFARRGLFGLLVGGKK